MDEVTDRQKLCEGNDSIIVISDVDFINNLVLYLSIKYGYKMQYIDLYNMYECDDEYVLEINNHCDNVMMCAEPLIDISFHNGCGYSRIFLNQDCIRQSVVDDALIECDEVMLFGIEQNKCNNNDCPWFEECI